MVKGSTMLVAGITFTCGLLLGMLLHLPGVISPSAPLRQRRDSGQFAHRTLLGADATPDATPDAAPNRPTHRNSSHAKSDKLLNTFAPVSKVGLVQTIAAFQKPSADSQAPKVVPATHERPAGKERGGGGGGLDTVLNKDGGVEHIMITGERGGETYQAARTDSFTDSHHNAKVNSDNEIEIELDNGRHRPDGAASKAREFNDEFNEQTLAELGVGNGIENGIYWSREVEENVVPRGFSDDDALRWRQMVDDGKVVRVTEGCGRMQNRQITFSDGTLACARYRLNTDQMQGEVYSYYLAQILDIRNVPPTLLQLADTQTDKWVSVADDVASAQWHPTKVVALTPWIDNLEPVFIPETLRPKEDKQLHPSPAFSQLTPKQMGELVQWSDLIVFDYLTANLDRVVNNMFNLQWNAGMMDSPAHNLERNANTGSLVFLDNESGLFHSYRLLGRYSSYHDELLKSLCVFRKKTAAMISRLHKSRDIGALLQTTLERSEPLARYLPRIPFNNVQTLQNRIDAVYAQIQHCQERFQTEAASQASQESSASSVNR